MGGAWDGGTTPTKTQRLSHHKTQTPTTHRMAYLHTHTHPTYTYIPTRRRFTFSGGGSTCAARTMGVHVRCSSPVGSCTSSVRVVAAVVAAASAASVCVFVGGGDMCGSSYATRENKKTPAHPHTRRRLEPQRSDHHRRPLPGHGPAPEARALRQLPGGAPTLVLGLAQGARAGPLGGGPLQECRGRRPLAVAGGEVQRRLPAEVGRLCGCGIRGLRPIRKNETRQRAALVGAHDFMRRGVCVRVPTPSHRP